MCRTRRCQQRELFSNQRFHLNSNFQIVLRQFDGPSGMCQPQRDGPSLVSALSAGSPEILVRTRRRSFTAADKVWVLRDIDRPFGGAGLGVSKMCAARMIDTREPIGAKASALYSVAQRMTTTARQLYHYEQAAMQAERAISLDPNGAGGALSVRGHANLRIARLGRPWRVLDARRDFADSLTARERSGASDPSIGEAEADLCFAMILTGHPFGGIARLRHGVERLRGNRSTNGRAFLARGLRKLEAGARLTWRLGLAEEARRERLAIATDIEAIDQMRDG